MNGTLLTDEIFPEVLLNPAKGGSDKLCIISGYASSAMAFHHSQKLEEINLEFNVNLIVGMTPLSGLSEANHNGFKSLMSEQLANKFSCSYLVERAAVHSKVYIWLKNNIPQVAYSGSANYSQQAFLGKQNEVLSQCCPHSAFDYYNSLIGDSIYCNHQDAGEVITLYKDNKLKSLPDDLIQTQNTDELLKSSLENRIIPLINNKDVVSSRSGLNWGQREGREPNQAYIPLRAEIYNTDFFPKIAQHFTIQTDDGKTLICVRAQDNGKAIQTTHNNSLLGEYFRNRLGVANGELVTIEHLINYGRTDVEILKVDEECYYMDFSV